MTELFIACLLIMLASLSGKMLVWRGAGAILERNLHLMVTFAAGVFLVFAFQLVTEVFEHMPAFSGLVWIVSGAIGITVVCRWLPHGHEVHERDADHHHEHEHVDAHRMLISDSIHNAADGILLAASFALGSTVGLIAAVSVFIHEVVQEVAEFFVLRDAGYSVRRALILNFATSSFVFLGAVGGFILFGLFETLEGPLLAIATGGILSVVIFDLLPNSIQDARSRSLIPQHVAWLLVGGILMYGVTVLVPHQDHSDNEVASYISASRS